MARLTRPHATLPTLEELSVPPFLCVNCFGELGAESAKLYCGQLCSQEAGYVRYARRCRQDGREQRPDVAQALRIRLALVLSGSYDAHARRLSSKVRQAVIRRDRGKCRVCGAPGAEIDHIRGSGGDTANLQLLCDSCHNKKTVAAFSRITEESHPEVWQRALYLRRRIESVKPLQLSDADEWAKLQIKLLAVRRVHTD